LASLVRGLGWAVFSDIDLTASAMPPHPQRQRLSLAVTGRGSSLRKKGKAKPMALRPLPHRGEGNKRDNARSATTHHMPVTDV